MDRRAFIGTSAAGLLGICLGGKLLSSCAPKSEEYSVVMLGDTHFDALDPELYHAGYTDPNPVREANHRKEFVRNADAWRGRCKELTQRAACLVDKDTRYVFQVGDLIQGDTAETPDQYGTIFVNDLPIFDECRSGVKSYSIAQSAGSYKLVVGDKVYVDYYAGNSPRLSKRFILRG